VTTVAVSGAVGRMGRLVTAAVAAAPDLELTCCVDPAGSGVEIGGLTVISEPAGAAADVVVDFTSPDAVMGNLAVWKGTGAHIVVGTSGFDAERVCRVEEMWADAAGNCLIVPNFSIGALLMMHLAEMAAPHFPGAEIIELHHDGKVDHPSGTAIATAQRMAAAGVPPVPAGAVRGVEVAGIPIHSVRLPGLVAHQLVMFGSAGETLSIRSDATSRDAYVPGVLLAIRGVAGLSPGVTVGLEPLLGLE